MDSNNNLETKMVLLEFKRDAILYDLKNIGYIINDTAQKKNPADGHNLIDIGEDGNVDRVTRIMNLAFADVLRFLAGYIKQNLEEDTFGHDVLHETESYFVMLDMSKNIPGSTIGVLRDYIHEYFIAKVMEDWTSITAPELQPVWLDKLNKLESSIKGCLGYRKGGVRIKMHPW